MAWSASDLTGPVVIEPDSQGNVFTIEFGTPAGRVAIMAEVELHEADGLKRIMLRRAHMHSEGGAHTIGVANLRVLAALLLERIGYDEAIVEGSARTTGANPNHTPRPIRFTCRDHPPHGA